MNDIGNIHLLDLENYGNPPPATTKNPFAQITWLFDKRIERETNTETRGHYLSARNFIIKYLQDIHGFKPFILNEHVDEFFLAKLVSQLDIHKNATKGARKLASYTLVGYLSSIRQVLLDGVNQKLLGCKEIHNVSIGPAVSETNGHKDYSDNEISQILSAVNEEMRLVKKIMAGYVPLKHGQGRDPRLNSRTKNGGKIGYGWSVPENLQWYFENVMHAIPVACYGDALKLHNRFFQHAGSTHGGLIENYHSWGVTHLVTSDLLMPIVVNLLYLTGLNPTSLIELQTDCYHDEHVLTGMPYLSFEKRRSGGEKELHLDLLENKSEITLKQKQAIHVKKSIELILNLTAKFRGSSKTQSSLKNRLLIYQASFPGKFEKTCGLISVVTSKWCQRMVEKYDLKNDDGGPLEFNLVRFRSTKLTQMALEGRDLFEIQQVALHANIATTVSYLNRNRLDIPARKIITDALQRIRENRESHQSECQASSNNTNGHTHPIKIYRGIISDCKNTYDPPESVKRLKDYVPGSACIRFNMCLFCHNVVIMKEHLPSLVAYRAQILSVKGNNVQNLPNADHYDQSLELINQLLDPENSEFTEEDIEWACFEAESLDVFVDPLIYHGVENAA